MDTPPTGHGASSLTGDSSQPYRANTRTERNVTSNTHGGSGKNVGNVPNSDDTFKVGVDEESLRIQEWLSPLGTHRRHHDVRNRRLGGVGDWVLRKNEFESWCNGREGSANPTLFCYGDQGVGKTYISSLVIDTLYEQARGQNIAVLPLYCDYQTQKDQTAVNMIGGLLRQVAVRATEIPGEILSAFEESRREGCKSLRLPEMLGLFVKTIGSFERAYVCFDAVDELVPEYRSEFFCALHQIIQEAPNTRLFLTGRPYIQQELDNHLAKRSFIIRIVADEGDIARYITKKMDDEDNRDPGLMTESLKNDIMKTVSENSSQMFLLVALNINAIFGEPSIEKRKEMLQKVATAGVDLDTVYAQRLQRIREQEGVLSRLGMEVLMWVSYAERPLQIDELRHALAVETGKRDIDPDNIRSQDTVLGSCLGLAVVDSGTSTVRLIHYTLQEYLSRPGILPDAHGRLSQTCLAYLNYEHTNGLPAKDIPNLRDMPFLEYSSLYWGIHGKIELSDCAKSLALRLLNRSGDHVSVTLLLNQIDRSHSCLLPNHLFPSLHAASYFGIVEVVATLVEMRSCEINRRDCMGLTPLMWAARQGNDAVVRLLLDRDDIDPGEPDNGGLALRDRASRSGHEGVVRPLLSRDGLNPDKSDNRGRTPLWWASLNGHQVVVELLLMRRDVDPDKPNRDGQTPLWQASFHGNEGVVRLLLARDEVDPDKPGEYGKTPLWWASWKGNEGVVRLLLTRNDVDPNKLDNLGYPPLWWASYHGHEGMVRLLLTRHDIDPNKPNKSGQTPLEIASKRGHTGIVTLLRQDKRNL